MNKKTIHQNRVSFRNDKSDMRRRASGTVTSALLNEHGRLEACECGDDGPGSPSWRTCAVHVIITSSRAQHVEKLSMLCVCLTSLLFILNWQTICPSICICGLSSFCATPWTTPTFWRVLSKSNRIIIFILLYFYLFLVGIFIWFWGKSFFLFKSTLNWLNLLGLGKFNWKNFKTIQGIFQFYIAINLFARGVDIVYNIAKILHEDFLRCILLFLHIKKNSSWFKRKIL